MSECSSSSHIKRGDLVVFAGNSNPDLAEAVAKSLGIKLGEVEVKKSGSKGYSYVTYKEIVKDDEIVKTETLSKSYYIPQDRVVVIGDGEDSDENDSNENSD